MSLTAITARNAKPREKAYKLAAGAGLYLEVMPSGARYWRMKYRYAGKEKRLALGVFPEVSLADARTAADDARALLRGGVDPSSQRRADNLAKRESAASSFEAIAREWLAKQAHMATTTYDKAKWTLETHAFPWLGKRPIADITPPELLTVLRRVEGRGKLETAQRLQQRCGQVFRYAIATARSERDPSADLRGALQTPKRKHHAAIVDATRIGELLRAIDGYSGNFVTVQALKLSPLVFLRPGEIRSAEWSEFDLKAAEWRIPAGKMKMRVEHIVPLSKQALAIIEELRPLTGTRQYLFPSLRSPKSCMSENTITAALRRLGYTGAEMTAQPSRAQGRSRQP